MYGPLRDHDAAWRAWVDAAWALNAEGHPVEPGQIGAIAGAARVANVGCFATGAISLIRPLRDTGLMAEDAPVVLTGTSGYTGGGKALIAEYEAGTAPDYFLYATAQTHKHVPEIMRYGRLPRQPAFQPAVGDYAQGMIVQMHLHREAFTQAVSKVQIEDSLRAFYATARFVDGLELFKIGSSWGGFESLMVMNRAGGLTRSVRPWTESEYILRAHIGLEDPDDLIADLEAGLARI